MLTKEILHRQKRHYTAPACGFWNDKIFSVLFLCKPERQTTPWLAASQKPELKRMKEISVFFSEKDLSRIGCFFQLIEK
ncbi:hypothetical protein [Citrobacter freundii]|uniref:Uncharacterized protein n=1 Tax=Citrobacter freundii TaxID=546 RepID=A0A7G2IPQ1_CITFR|nr:hypothetical protein [Citrobacter freundii]